VNKEIRLRFSVGFLEITAGADVLETNFLHQSLQVGLAKRKHIQMKGCTIGEAVPETRQ
jgi:hypothetical protein